jgi:hypothetical protein
MVLTYGKEKERMPLNNGGEKITSEEALSKGAVCLQGDSSKTP